MEYLLDKQFPFGLDNLFKEDELNDKGLSIIEKIKSEHIKRDSKELKELFKNIDSKCINKRLWILLGSSTKTDWLPLQLASISANDNDIRKEIKTDLRRMLPFDPIKDKKVWSSYFYKNVMEVEIGRDHICQKYSKLKEKCSYLAIAVLTKEEYDIEKHNDISIYQIKEIELANDLKPLIWNPSPKEKQFLRNK